MAGIWFLLALLFFILWISRKPKAADQSEDYRQGYWDGYRSFGRQIQQELDKGSVDQSKLRKFIAEGYPPGQQPEATAANEPFVQSYESTEETTEAIVSFDSELVVELTADQREAQTVRNLNTMLYVASFLLVAAAAIFVAASMPPVVRLVGIWAVVTLFYGAGLFLYKNVERLQSAAVAFLGTGLAILPFAGFALYQLGGMSSEITWLITSLIGLVAYCVAAVITKSQLVSYLTMAFVLSLALSSVAVISAPIVWYFIVLISISLIANSIHFLKPTWLPEFFTQPVESTGQIVTPLALIASLVIADRMSLQTYELVFAVATAHYLVVWLQVRSLMYETVIRVLAHCSLLFIGWDMVGQDPPSFAWVWLALGIAQAAYSLVRLRPRNNESRHTESIWLVSMQTIILCGSILWASSEHVALGTLANFVAIGVLSIIATTRLRVVTWAIPALGVSLVLPFIIGRWLAEPVWDWPVLSSIFMIAALSVVVTYYRVRQRLSVGVERFLRVSFWLYLSFGMMTILNQADALVFGWAGTVAALLAVVFSFVSHRIGGEIVSAVLYIAVVGAWLSESLIDHSWYVTALVLISSGGLFIAAAAHHSKTQVPRRNVMLAAAQIVLAGLIFTLGAEREVVLTSLIVMLAATVTAFSLRTAVRNGSKALQQIFMMSYVSYIVIAWLLSFGLDRSWAIVVYLAATVLTWAASYVERSPVLVVAGNIIFVAAVTTLWQWLELDVSWTTLGVAWITSLVFYGAYWLLMDRQDVWRQHASLVSVWIVLGSAALLQFGAGVIDQQVAAAGTLIAVAGTLGVYGYLEQRWVWIEASVYLAAFGAQRIIGLLIPELNMVFYAHVSALVIGLMAWWRLNEPSAVTRMRIAMGLVTIATGLKALEEGGSYQLLFLAEHVGLLIVGGITQKMWAVWWGVAATVLAVLYFLKDYPYVALAFLGLVLIAIVIFRLNRTDETQNPRV